MERIEVQNWFMETAPPQIISVGKLSRESKYEMILENSIVLSSEYLGNTASLVTLGAMAPATVISVKKKAYAIGVDIIWEETMHYAEYFVFEAADVILSQCWECEENARPPYLCHFYIRAPWTHQTLDLLHHLHRPK
uniref:Uncharacterized protein n=1 Tax=Physcomitrium patens TaxID=3218 RepID=A0A2K1JW65_PHYPA|nr:hypothetical protein PHYPA_015539 [Physcomitrium patens]